MSDAIGPIPRDRAGVTPLKEFGAYVSTGVTFLSGWYLARNASGLLVVGAASTTLMPGGFATRDLVAAAVSTDTDLANVECGIYSVLMLWASKFTVADKPGPIYCAGNQEFAKSGSGRSIAGLFLCLDDSSIDTSGAYARCVAWIGPEGAAMAKGIADAATASNPVTDEWTNAAAVSTTALKAATATTVAPQTISSFVTGGVAALLAYPRNVTITGGSTTADCPSTVDIVGTDINDDALLETIALTSGSGTSVKAFKTLTSAAYGAGGGTGGTCAIGIGGKFGLTHTIMQRIALPHVIQEMAIDAVVTTGTYVSAATSPPNGTYAPAAPPDGTKGYALTYEKD